MLELAAITIGLLAFCGWSVLMLFGGYSLCRRRVQNAQQQRIDALVESAQKLAKQITSNTERPTPSADARKRAQA